jgi:DNA polymerase, archaea type
MGSAGTTDQTRARSLLAVPTHPALRDEWLWGWDPTPGIVSVWAEQDGRATVWRRLGGELRREEARFRPWALLARAEDVPAGFDVRELDGPGALRYLVSGPDGRRVAQLRELGDAALVLAPDEQYLVATGRTYFRDLAFDDLRRMQIDLETTGLDPATSRVFLIAMRTPDGAVEILEDDQSEAMLLRRLVDRVRFHDPDVIENHHLHGFDLPFLARRAQALRVQLALGRVGGGLRERAAARGTAVDGDDDDDRRRRIRYIAPGRELIDTLDAVRRHDFSARDLPGHGLKAVARHFGLARADREHVPGGRVYETWRRDPARVRRYAADDVHEAAGLARLLGGAAFALAKMAPRRYERLADAGPATGVLDPLLVRAYLRAGAALPRHEPGDGTSHSGAALHLFAAGVAHRIVKADVASLYPSLMREHQIGPARDRLGVLVTLVDRLVEQRLAAKARAKAAAPGSPERHTDEALSAAMKLVVNSAYGYLGAVGLTRFADVHAANEVTRHGRELLGLLCRELAARGAILLEADTDGVYFAVPAGWTEADERRAVAEVAALLPPKVQLEYEGATPRCSPTSRRTTRSSGTTGSCTCAASRSARAAPSRSARRSCAARSAACSSRTCRACRRRSSTRCARCAAARSRPATSPRACASARAPTSTAAPARSAASCPTRRCSPRAATRGRRASASASTARPAAAPRSCPSRSTCPRSIATSRPTAPIRATTTSRRT